MASFAAILLISNISATKLIALGPILTDGGAVLFPFVYVLGDILTEVYGYKYARRALWAGFGIMLLAALTFTLVAYLPAAPAYKDQAAFTSVLGFFPQIVIASLAAYLIGGFLNAYTLAKLKIKTKGKSLWFRLVSSTIVGEFFDTIVFAVIAFGGMIAGWDMVNYMLVGWLFKVTVEIVMLPVTYRIINYLKTKERIDTYDRKTNFTPFHYALDR